MKIYLRYQILIFTTLLFAGFIFTGASSAGAGETLILAGNGSSVSVMERVADDFQKRYPNVIVSILPSIGSTGGIKAVGEEKIDIGLSTRSLKPEERNLEIVEEAYGRTAFIFGVQELNPVEGIRLSEIEEIYAGGRRTWPDGKPIRIVLRPLSDAYSVFLAGISPDMKSAYEQAHFVPGVFVGITDSEAAVQIQKTPGSFGVTSTAIVEAEKLKIKALSVDGVLPTLPNVASGKYPYVLTMSVVYREDKYKGALKDFISFIFSNDGRKLLSANGYVALPRMVGK